VIVAGDWRTRPVEWAHDGRAMKIKVDGNVTVDAKARRQVPSQRKQTVKTAPRTNVLVL